MGNLTPEASQIIINQAMEISQLKRENAELKAKIEKVSGDALSNYYENVELKTKVAKLDSCNYELQMLLRADKASLEYVQAQAILKAISALGTHWADNIGEEVIRVDLLERYADKLERGES